MWYSEEDLKKIEKQNKETIIRYFKEINHEVRTVSEAYSDLENRLFDVKSCEYNRGYADGMKRMLMTIEKVFGCSEEAEER